MKAKLEIWLRAGLVAFAPAAWAATLSMVPMQGSMVMPMVSYHAHHGHLHVMMPSEVPQLTPLMVSHPQDRFNPADPWFDDLDPSRKGLSFSRRYGFVMDSMSDPLPPDTTIWLRKLAGSAELSFYRYSAAEPKRWEPIFGTAGSPAALAWNGMMFHPAVTALPGTNELRATFEAVLVNNTTGEEVHHSSSGPFEFRFTNVPDGRPSLDIALKAVITWPADAAGWILEEAATLPAAEWQTVVTQPVLIGGEPTVLLEPAAEARFFRLRPPQ